MALLRCHRLTFLISISTRGQIVYTTLLLAPRIFRPSYGPEFVVHVHVLGTYYVVHYVLTRYIEGSLEDGCGVL